MFVESFADAPVFISEIIFLGESCPNSPNCEDDEKPWKKPLNFSSVAFILTPVVENKLSVLLLSFWFVLLK